MREHTENGEFRLKTYITVPEECEEASKHFTENDWKALVDANERISERNTYGVRTEKTTTRGTIITWSNGRKEWLCHPEPVPAGKELRLDANMVFLPISPERCRRIRPCLIDLPLYYCSTEAVIRGEVPWEEAGRQ